MLAERSDEHNNLFTENNEAVYFSSDKEMLDKISFYLSHKDERNKIADAGYDRCINSGYTYDDRVKEILNNLFIN